MKSFNSKNANESVIEEAKRVIDDHFRFIFKQYVGQSVSKEEADEVIKRAIEQLGKYPESMM